MTNSFPTRRSSDLRLEKLDQRHAIGVAEAASDILMASVMIPADVGLELETGVALAANADFHRIEFTAADHDGLGSRLFAESDLSLSWHPKDVAHGHLASVHGGHRCTNPSTRPRSTRMLDS